MLFKKNNEPSCMYCKHGSKLSGCNIACLKRGIVGAGDMCRRFSYDPLKRVPARPLKLAADKYSETDFTL